MRYASSTGTRRSSSSSTRAALSIDECVCSLQTTTRRSGMTARAAASAVSVAVDAVSSMCAVPLARQAEQLAEPRRRRAPRAPRAPGDVRQRMPTWFSATASSSARIAGLRAGVREVREEARMLPVRDRGQDQPSRSSSSAENGSAVSGGDSGSRSSSQPGSTCASTGSSPTRSRYDAAHSSAAAPSRLRSTRPALPDPLDLLPRPRVHDVRLRQPRAPRLADPELDVVLRADLVAVGVDDELQPRLARRARVHVAQVEPVRLRVDLEERLRLERLLDHALEVDVDRRRACSACGPVRWPMQSTYGFSIAAKTRSSGFFRRAACTDATTQSSVASCSSGMSSVPSALMLTSTPRRMRNGATSSCSAAISSACASSRPSRR